jgi:hypothetical protein
MGLEDGGRDLDERLSFLEMESYGAESDSGSSCHGCSCW